MIVKDEEVLNGSMFNLDMKDIQVNTWSGGTKQIGSRMFSPVLLLSWFALRSALDPTNFNFKRDTGWLFSTSQLATTRH